MRKPILALTMLALTVLVANCGKSGDDGPGRPIGTIREEALLCPEPGYRFYECFQLTKAIPAPVGTKVAFIAGHSYQDEEIMVWDYGRNTLQNVTRNFGKRSCYARIRWSPDGRAIAAPLHNLPGSGNPLYVLWLDTGQQTSLGGCDVSNYAWSPDGKRIAYADVDRHLYVANVDGSDRKRLTKKPHLAIHDLVWWRDGGREVIAFVAGWLMPEKNVFVAPTTGAGETQITKKGNYGYLDLDDDGRSLQVVRLNGEKDLPMDRLRIAPGSHKETFVEKMKEYLNLNQGTLEVLHPHLDKVVLANGATLNGRVVAGFLLERALENAKEQAAKIPFALQPDPATTEPKGPMVRLPKTPLPLRSTTVVASTVLEADRVSRVFEVGPVGLELLGIQVQPMGEAQAEVRVLLRYEHRIGQAYLSTTGSPVMPFEVQEQYRPATPQETARNLRGHYRSYSIAVSDVTVDPTTGVWSRMTFRLLRYDEAQQMPSIRQAEPSLGKKVSPSRISLPSVRPEPAPK